VREDLLKFIGRAEDHVQVRLVGLRDVDEERKSLASKDELERVEDSLN